MNKTLVVSIILVIGVLPITANAITIHPSIEITKTVDPCEACPGETVFYTICIENTGDWPLDNVDVHDPLLCPVYGCPLPGFPSVLFPGEVGCVSFEYTIPQDASVPYCGEGVFENWAEVTANPVDFLDVIDANDCATICCPSPPPSGCTLGFWKKNADNHGASAWCDRFSPSDTISDHFFLNEPLEIRGKGKSTITDPTLLQALEANGGGVNAMIRQGVAAMLNACSDCVNYEISDPLQVIMMIEETLNGEPGADTVDELHSMFAEWNEAGCPLNLKGDCVGVVVEEAIDGY